MIEQNKTPISNPHSKPYVFKNEQLAQQLLNGAGIVEVNSHMRGEHCYRVATYIWLFELLVTVFISWINLSVNINSSEWISETSLAQLNLLCTTILGLLTGGKFTAKYGVRADRHFQTAKLATLLGTWMMVQKMEVRNEEEEAIFLKKSANRFDKLKLRTLVYVVNRFSTEDSSFEKKLKKNLDSNNSSFKYQDEDHFSISSGDEHLNPVVEKNSSSNSSEGSVVY